MKKKKTLLGTYFLDSRKPNALFQITGPRKSYRGFLNTRYRQMAMMFGSQETVHAVAYSYLNETLGLEDYEAFLHEPATARRFDNLVAYEGNCSWHC